MNSSLLLNWQHSTTVRKGRKNVAAPPLPPKSSDLLSCTTEQLCEMAIELGKSDGRPGWGPAEEGRIFRKNREELLRFLRINAYGVTR